MAAASSSICQAAPPGKNTLNPPRFEIKGMFLGMTNDQLTQLYPSLGGDCNNEVCSKYGRLSEEYETLEPIRDKVIIKDIDLMTIGGACPILSAVAYLGPEKTIKSVKVTFKEYCFNGIVDAFFKKYGKPRKKIDEKVTTLGGANLTDTIYLWRDKESQISLRRFNASVSESVIALESLVEIEKEIKSRKQQRDSGI